jgi:hypothetical protein
MSELMIEVLSPAELGHPVRMIEIELRHGNERRDLVLDNECRRLRATFSAADGTREIQYRYRVYVNPDIPGAAQRFETPVETSDASILVVDPSRVVRVERVMATAVFSTEVYRTAFVDVRALTAGEPIAFTMEVDKERPQAAYLIAVPAGAPLDLQARVRYVKLTGELVEGQWQATDRFTIVVANPVNEPVTA